MNHFLFNYKGNKYFESKKMFNNFDFSKYDIIAEPFCGIFGFSRFAYEKGFTGEFYLNDFNSQLIDLLKQLKDDPDKLLNNLETEINKYKVDKELSSDKNKSYSLGLIAASINEQLCSISKGKTKINNYRKKKDIYKQFFEKVSLYNLDANEFIKQLPKNKKILIFYDPPYFNSSNTTYQMHLNKNLDGYNDGTQMYLNIHDNFKNIHHSQIIIINHIAIIHYFFKEYYILTITGKYQIGRKNIKKHNLYQKL